MLNCFSTPWNVSGDYCSECCTGFNKNFAKTFSIRRKTNNVDMCEQFCNVCSIPKPLHYSFVIPVL